MANSSRDLVEGAVGGAAGVDRRTSGRGQLAGSSQGLGGAAVAFQVDSAQQRLVGEAVGGGNVEGRAEIGQVEVGGKEIADVAGLDGARA